MNRSSYNPYYNVASIDNPSLFFGRLNDIEVLLNALFSGPPQCYSIVGQRKIGKTSLVQHLSCATTIREFGFSPENHLFVYFDCQRHTDALKKTDSFYTKLLNRLRSTMPVYLAEAVLVSPVDSDDASDKWEQVLKELGEQGYCVIAIFDEFEKAIIQESLIKGGFFGSLRGIAQANSNFAWLTCTRLPLHNLFKEAFDDYGISDAKRKSESDFYNIAPSHSLGLFGIFDTLELITSPSKQHGVNFSPEDIEIISNFGGDFPYFIQRACYHSFNAYPNRITQRESLLRLCVRESIQLWEDFWSKLSTRQQALLSSIADGQQVEADTYEIETLKDTALIYEDNNKNLLPFSHEFGRFIRPKWKEIQSKDTNQRTYHLFISYSHDDKEKVNLLIEHLRANGFRLWVDEEQIGGGDQLRKVMVDGIKQSAHVMICLSPSYLEKKWTTFESAVNQAMDPDNRDHRTIPVVIEPCEIPEEYAWLYYPVLTDPVNWETEYQKAIKNIRR